MEDLRVAKSTDFLYKVGTRELFSLIVIYE